MVVVFSTQLFSICGARLPRHLKRAQIDMVHSNMSTGHRASALHRLTDPGDAYALLRERSFTPFKRQSNRSIRPAPPRLARGHRGVHHRVTHQEDPLPTS